MESQVAIHISWQVVARGVFRKYLEHMYKCSRNMQLLEESIWKEASSKSYLVPPDSSYDVFQAIKLTCDFQCRRIIACNIFWREILN